jgi:hypothetical protein
MKELMFKKSGMSIAMGNSGKEVQAEANFVTDSNEEEGFATPSSLQRCVTRYSSKSQAVPGSGLVISILIRDPKYSI